MDIFGESVNNSSSQSSEDLFSIPGSSDLIINGTLIETKLSIYGKVRCTFSVLLMIFNVLLLFLTVFGDSLLFVIKLSLVMFFLQLDRNSNTAEGPIIELIASGGKVSIFVENSFRFSPLFLPFGLG